MAVNGGAGNSISFSELRDFYGDDPNQPVSLSEYNRGGTLVPQTFVGSQTVTQNTDVTYSNNTATFDDFQVDKSTGSTFSQGSPGSRVVRTSVSSGQYFVPATGSYTVVASDAIIMVAGSGIRNEGDDVFSSSGSFTTSGVITDNSGSYTSRIYPGPAYQSGDHSSFATTYAAQYMGGSPCSTGTLTATSSAHSGGGQIIIYSARRSATTTFDVTLQNTSSVSTYTITGGSTGTETVYSPGESQTILDDQLAEGWLVAYDNVTGSGAGSAGDIDVTVATVYTGTLSPAENQAAITASQNSATSGTFVSTSYTVRADDAVLFITGGGINHVGGEQESEATGSHSATRNGSTLYGSTSHSTTKRYRGPASDGTEHSGASFSGSLSAGDVIVVTATVGTISGSATISVRRRNAQYKAVFTNSSSSKSYTLEGGSGKTSGISSGSVVMAPGDTRDATSPGNSATPSWEIHFDTSSGNCNTNIPTTISAGNPVNMNLFNAPGTPVG